ncbi:MaoC/PaaZ C-terminal domain-containing protein [Gammaproteobacteria bacterium]|nr:MaoC/PaaZ C-terminal domain-containing protein [Gammaproteobacteria bacterium]
MLRWDKYLVGMELSWSFHFSERDMEAFAALSQDYNPVHLDNSFAQSKGYEAPIIHGLLLSTQMSRLIGQELPDKHAILTGIKMDFLQPCFANNLLIFHAELISKSEAALFLEFKCKIMNGDVTASRGKVNAVWKP